MKTLLNRYFVVVLLGCLLYTIHIVSCHSEFESLLPRTKRSENKRPCLDERAECRRNGTCRRALNRVMKKCTANGPRCSADEEDIDRCVDDLQTIWSIAFSSDEICECNYRILLRKKNKLQICSNIFNNVHYNPCYDLGLKLREQANQTSTATTQIVGFVDDTKTTLYPLHVLSETDSSAEDILNATSSTSQTLTSHHQGPSQIPRQASSSPPRTETTGSANSPLSCSGKLLLTGGICLFVVLAMSIGTFIYCKRKRHPQYTKATGLKKTSLYITYKKKKSNLWNNSNDN